MDFGRTVVARNSVGLGQSIQPVNNVNGLFDDRGADCYTDEQLCMGRSHGCISEQGRPIRNDLDNVLLREVIDGAPCQLGRCGRVHVINHIGVLTRRPHKAKQHPLGMSAYDFRARTIPAATPTSSASPADWVALAGRTNPASVKPTFSNQGQHFGHRSYLGLDPADDDSPWVWKSLTRGHDPIYADPWTYAGYKPASAEIRAAMERARV